MAFNKQAYVEAMGGLENIKDVDGCATRIRATVVDPAKVDVKRLQTVGIIGRPMIQGKGVQVVVGTQADLYGQELMAMLKRK